MSLFKAKISKFVACATAITYLLNLSATVSVNANDPELEASVFSEFQTTDESPVTVTKDENGWSQLAFKDTVSPDDIGVLYVSAATDGTGAGLDTNPYSFAELNSYLNNKNNTKHLVIRFKCGDEFVTDSTEFKFFTKEIDNLDRKFNRVLILTYYGDESLGRPKFSSADKSFIFTNGQEKNNIFIIGLEFERRLLLDETELRSHSSMLQIVGGNGAAGSDQGQGIKNILIEDCKFNYTFVDIRGNGENFASNIGLRRNIFDKNYAANDDRIFESSEKNSGISITRAKSVLIEENVFIDTGWSEKMIVKGTAKFNINNTGKINAIRLYENIGSYSQISVLNPVVKGNIIFNPANKAIEAVGGAIIKDNFISRACEGILVATSDIHSTGREVQVLVSDNVVTEGRVINPHVYLVDPTAGSMLIGIAGITKAGKDGQIYAAPLVERNLVVNRLYSYGLDGISPTAWPHSIRSVYAGDCTDAKYKDNLAYNWKDENTKPEGTGLDEEWADKDADLGKYNKMIVENADYAAIYDEVKDKIYDRVKTRFENTMLEPQFKYSYNGETENYDAGLVAHIEAFFDFSDKPDNKEVFDKFLEYYTFIEMCAAREVGQWLPAYTAAEVNNYFRACFNPKLQAKLTLTEITGDAPKVLGVTATIGPLVKYSDSIIMVGERDANGNVVRLTKQSVNLTSNELATEYPVDGTVVRGHRTVDIPITVELPDNFDDSDYFVLLWDKEAMTPLSYSVSPGSDN